MKKLEDFNNKLKTLESKYSEFFESKENNVSSIDECYTIDNETGVVRLAIRKDRNIPKDLDKDIVRVFHAVFDQQ